MLALGDDADGEFCQFQWLEGPNTNQTTYYYTPESFKPLLPVENKQEKSLDNLLKELHNLKQEQKAISNKIDNILNEINDVMKENGLNCVHLQWQASTDVSLPTQGYLVIIPLNDIDIVWKIS